MGHNNLPIYPDMSLYQIILQRISIKNWLKLSRVNAICLILFLFGILIFQGLAQTLPDTVKQDTIKNNKPPAKKDYELGEEMIKGEASFKISDQRIYLVPMFDFFAPINEIMKPDEYIFDEKLAMEISSQTLPNPILRSGYLRVPLKRDFLYGDVLLFIPKFENRVANWELVISNSLGQTVRRIADNGNPSPVIAWDGRTDGNEVIATGEIYTFTFNAYDALGNQTRILGQPRKISGIVYEEDDATIININGDEVFIHGTEQLNDSLALSRIDEAANIIKERFKSKKSSNKEIVIYVYTDNEELSLKQCNILKNEFSKRLVLSQDSLKVAPKFFLGLKPKYSKIEIQIH